MKKFLKEWKIPLLALFFILLLGFELRTINLTSFPIFADEAIYIRWAQVMKNESTLRFLPLSDGKPPLFMWSVIPALKLFSDPLFAGRIISVFTGIGTITGVFTLSYLFFQKKHTSLIAALFYTLSPFSFFFDRMALVDSMLTFFGLWTLIFATLTVKHMRFDLAMVTGYFLGASLLTKPPALFFALLLPSLVLLAKLPKQKNKKSIYIAKLFSFYLIILAIAYGIYNILRLGPNFHQLSSRNYDYVYPFSHLFERPLDPLLPFLHRTLLWLEDLGPYLLVAFFIVGVIMHFKKYPKKYLILLSWTFIPVIISAEFAQVFTARYVLFALPTFIILSSTAFLDFKNKLYRNLSMLVILWFIIHAISINYFIITGPERAPLPSSERSGYLEEWSSGTGIRESADIIKKMAAENPSQHFLIGTEGFFGTLPDGMQVYLEGIKNVTVIGVGQNISHIPQSLVDSKVSGNRTFLAANSSRLVFERDNFDEYGLNVVYSIKKAERLENSHERAEHGPNDTYYLFEIEEIPANR